jgi:hypothetical protein
MSVRDISVIIVVGVWLIALFIFGMLALNFKRKHAVFTSYRDQQEKDYNDKVNDYKIKPIKIAYEMPAGEICYYVGESLVFKKVVKESRSQKRYDKMLAARGFSVDKIDEDDDDWKDASFRQVFNAERHQFSVIQREFQKAQYQGKFYVTNSRILIEGADSSYQIPIKEIRKVQLAVFMYRGVYYNGIRMTFTKNEYDFYITYDNIDMYFSIRTLISQKEK